MIKRAAALGGPPTSHEYAYAEAAAMIDAIKRESGPAYVRGPGGLPADRLSRPRSRWRRSACSSASSPSSSASSTPASSATLPFQLFGIVSNDLLLAIPFFTFMGAILERCGLAEDLLERIGQLFGSVRGGLVLCGDLRRRDPRRDHRHGRRLGHRHGRDLAAGDDALWLRYAARHRRHRGVRHDHPADPALAGPRRARRRARPLGRRHVRRRDRPSLLQVGLFCLGSILAVIRPKTMPPLPPEARTLQGWPLIWKCSGGIVPSVGLIFLVLGTIFMGLATPTEAGAMGAVGSLRACCDAIARLTWTLINQAMRRPCASPRWSCSS